MAAQAGRLSRIMDKGGGAQLRLGSKERRARVSVTMGVRGSGLTGGDWKGYPVSGLSKRVKSGGTGGWWSKNLHFTTRWGGGPEGPRDGVTLPRSQGKSRPTAQLILCCCRPIFCPSLPCSVTWLAARFITWIFLPSGF